ncbi:MAG: helix-turn-helix domain-containing protein [Myxococcota bacterium]
MARAWLDRFVDCRPLTESAAFRIVGAFDLELDRRVTVVAAREGSDKALAAAALDRLFAAHRAPPHPSIAPSLLRARHADGDYASFDFPARVDLDTLIECASKAGWRARFEAADGFTSEIRGALLASAERRDDAGRALCLGTFAPGNVAFAADGSHALVGFGHNVVCLDEHGRFVPRGRFFQAWEVVAGAEPTASSDLIAMIRMSRLLIAFAEVPERIANCLKSQVRPEDRELADLLMRFEMTVVQSSPPLRPPVPEILAMSQRIRDLLGVSVDVAGFRDQVARFIASERPDLLGTPRTMRVGPDAAWLVLDAERAALSPLLRRLLRALVTARLDHPGRPLSADALVDAGWPDERMDPTSRKNRLHVALNGLRKSGLGDELEFEGGGYRLRPSLRVELESG